MRSPLDRIRQAVSFELIALILITPLGAYIFEMPMQNIGAVVVVSATIATFWNIGYNFLFDLAMQRYCGTTEKRFAQRVLHSVLFEVGLILVLMPFIAWYLGVSVWQALVMDLSFSVFYMLYAFVFNWAYDRIFPLPEWSSKGSSGGTPKAIADQDMPRSA